MAHAIEVAEKARLHAPPNPWVGAVLIDEQGVVVGEGHTQAPGLAHAEIEALRHAGARARGATLYVTLEPCAHQGRTGPCTQALIDAGVSRVVVAQEDPDERVNGRGVSVLRAAGITVDVGAGARAAADQLRAYRWHRQTGRPYVVLKVASTMDGIIAMADGSSQWITSPEARQDVHLLRAQSQAIVVGAGTVRFDNPRLTARLGDVVIEPLRVVLGDVAPDAAVQPCRSYRGGLATLLDELGAEGVLQILVEGGPVTWESFLREGLANQLTWYFSPSWAGGKGTRSALPNLSTPTISLLSRGRVVDHQQLGADVRVDVEL